MLSQKNLISICVFHQDFLQYKPDGIWHNHLDANNGEINAIRGNRNC